MATDGGRTRHLDSHRLAPRLALGLTAAALAVPAVAAGHTDGGGPANASAPAAATHATQPALRRDGSNAATFVAQTSPTSSASPTGPSATGFDWGDAMVGAGGAAALIAVIGAGGYTVRNRRRIATASAHGRAA
jgi:hypothetical protein